jgi:hypothetical protein
MKIEYDYTGSQDGPPRNYKVTVEGEAELYKVVDLLLTTALNSGRMPAQAFVDMGFDIDWFKNGAPVDIRWFKNGALA